MNTKSLGIRTKILLGFFILTLIMIVSVVGTLIITSSTSKTANEVIQTELPLYNSLVDINSEVFLAYSSLQSWVNSSEEKYKLLFSSAWEDIDQRELALDEHIKNSSNQELQKHWLIFKNLLSQLKTSQNNIISAADKSTTIKLLTTSVQPLMEKIIATLNAAGNKTQLNQGLLDFQYSYLNSGSKNLLSDMSTLIKLEYIILFLFIFVSLIIYLLTTESIVPPLKNAIEIAKHIAAGERKIKITVSSQDETGELLSALDIMQKSIRENEIKIIKNEAQTKEMFDKVVHSANQYSDHSSRVASGDLRHHLDIPKIDNDIMSQLGNDLNTMTDNLSNIAKQITQVCQNMVATVEEVRHSVEMQSNGAAEQASSINEITASLSEIEKSSAQTMSKAKLLGESAERTRAKGQMGLESVDQSINGMKEIREKVQTIAQTILDLSNQTQQVGEITAAVNNLAQQSKMLALNASIEAAKAGEAGKGFAVVAAEVKNLAEQSEHATTQVQKILEDIRHAAEKAVMVTEEGTKGVDHGTSLVEQTGEIIQNLSEVIHETTIASQQIESAVNQESAGLEQITAGMKEINQVTSTFLESVKQTTEAMSNLAMIAKNLKEFVDTYKL